MGGFVNVVVVYFSLRALSLPLAGYRVRDSLATEYKFSLKLDIPYLSFSLFPPPNPTCPSPHPTYTSAKTLSDSDIFRTLPPPFDLSGFFLFARWVTYFFLGP